MRLIPGKRLTVTAAAAVAALLLLAACGSSKGASATPMPSMPMATMSVAGGTPSAPATANAVNISNFAFAPATVSVAAGTTITWTNRDQVAHTVSDTQNGIASPVLNQNQTYSHTFTQPGTYHYICTIHPFMHGTVVVTA